MAVDVLKRLSGPTALTASAATQYTAPALTTTTIKAIRVANETGTAATLNISVGTDGANKRFIFGLSIPANGSYDWQGTVVLAAAEIIQAYSGTASALTMMMSGVETV